MRRIARLALLVPVVLSVAVTAVSAAGDCRFEDVVRNLRNPDPKIRLSARPAAARGRVHRSDRPDRRARHRSDRRDSARGDRRGAVVLPGRDCADEARVAFVLSKCATRRRAGGLRARARWRCGRGRRPRNWSMRCCQAVDDENPQGSARGDLRAGRRGAGRRSPRRPPASSIKALDHYDPAIRAAAAQRRWPASGEGRRRRVDQGGQRFERAGALRGDARARRYSVKNAPCRR